MNSRCSTLLFTVLLLAAFGTANAAGSDTHREQLQTGAKAWEQNCARCHKLREPGEFPDPLWRPIVAHMRVRAGLTGEEARAIVKFLQAAN
jgi:mono/diheme cytochrome c family protein